MRSVDNRRIEGVSSRGASRIRRCRNGGVLQIMPDLLSQCLRFLEPGTRAATVIGTPGAGGIGLVPVGRIKTARDRETTAHIAAPVNLVAVQMDRLSGWLGARPVRGNA